MNEDLDRYLSSIDHARGMCEETSQAVRTTRMTPGALVVRLRLINDRISLLMDRIGDENK